MIKIGDRVTHRTFPPVDGIVSGAIPILNGEPKISVLQDNGTIFWDFLSSWDVIESSCTQDETVGEEETYEDVIDVEYKEI